MTQPPLYERFKPNSATTAEREVHLQSLQQSLAKQELDLQRRQRELGRAEQELEDERQILLQDKLAFERMQAQPTSRRGVILVPLLMAASIAIGYAGFTQWSNLGEPPQLAASLDKSRALGANSDEDRMAQYESVIAMPVSQTPHNPTKVLQEVDAATQALIAMTRNPPAAGPAAVNLQQSAAARADELIAQLEALKLELQDQNVLLDFEEVYVESQASRLADLAQRLAVREQELQKREADYERLLSTNRALVRELNQLRGN